MLTKIYLAAVSHVKNQIVGKLQQHYLLESFMDLRGDTDSKTKYTQWWLSSDDVLLDSGAFSFMNKSKKTESFNEQNLRVYIEDYIQFVNRYNIKKFFEMDLDCVIGYEKVKEVRKYIEQKTQKQVIPVWHITRGIDEFHNMCKQYRYVSIGGIASKEIKVKDHYILFDLCDIAHKYGCTVHGLGYMPLSILNENKCPFDTIDGTSWQGHMRKKSFVLNNNIITKVNDNRKWNNMKKDQKSLIIIISIFVSALLTSNIISSNGMIFTGISIGSITLLAPAAVLAYAITFLCTDIIGQNYGKKEANFAVICGLVGQVICSLLIWLTPIIFKPWFQGSEVYSSLNSLGWFTVGSLIAYCCSQTYDVFVFHKIKEVMKSKLGEEKYNKHRWLWNNASTMTSQIIDTVIFIGIGFGVGLGYSGMELVNLMIGQYCIKFCLALLDTPFFYLFTRNKKKSV